MKLPKILYVRVMQYGRDEDECFEAGAYPNHLTVEIGNSVEVGTYKLVETGKLKNTTELVLTKAKKK